MEPANELLVCSMILDSKGKKNGGRNQLEDFYANIRNHHIQDQNLVYFLDVIMDKLYANKVNSINQSNLLIEATKFNRPLLVKRLLELNCNVDQWDSAGFTPLFYAIAIGSVEILILLLSKNPNLLHINENGQSPFDLARQSSHQNKEHIIHVLTNYQKSRLGLPSNPHQSKLVEQSSQDSQSTRKSTSSGRERRKKKDPDQNTSIWSQMKDVGLKQKSYLQKIFIFLAAITMDENSNVDVTIVNDYLIYLFHFVLNEMSLSVDNVQQLMKPVRDLWLKVLPINIHNTVSEIISFSIEKTLNDILNEKKIHMDQLQRRRQLFITCFAHHFPQTSDRYLNNEYLQTVQHVFQKLNEVYGALEQKRPLYTRNIFFLAEVVTEIFQKWLNIITAAQSSVTSSFVQDYLPKLNKLSDVLDKMTVRFMSNYPIVGLFLVSSFKKLKEVQILLNNYLVKMEPIEED